MWNLPAPPGFQGFREDLPLETYEQILPHWRQDGATYFVTFRLGDSLPQPRLRELKRIREEWERANPLPRSREDLEAMSRTLFDRIEKWLDQGFGSCVLRKPENAQHLARQIQKSHNNSCEVGCFVLMPNHVHAVVRPLRPKEESLEDILRIWKGASASLIRTQTKTGGLWQRESFDRIIRDEEHLYRVIQYIGRNPIRAKLKVGDFMRWINPRWEELGWRFEM